MKKIAVIGAGGTGVALSAILASKGHEVYLADNLNQTVVEAAQEAGVLRTKGTKVCEGRPALVTSNIEEAVRCAELIVCCTISNRDEEIARTLAPVVTKDQAVLVGAGNGATIVYHKIFEEAGKGDVLTAAFVSALMEAFDGGQLLPRPRDGRGGVHDRPSSGTEGRDVLPAAACRGGRGALRGGLGAQSLRQHDGRAL